MSLASDMSGSAQRPRDHRPSTSARWAGPSCLQSSLTNIPGLAQVVDKLDSKTPRLCKPYRDTFVGVVSSGIVRELFSLHHVDPEIASISDAPHLEKIVPTIEYTTVPFRNLCLYEQISHVASLFAGEQSTIAYHLKVDLNKEDPKA